MTEEWRETPGNPTHSISDLGRIRCNKSGRVLRPWKNTKGYLVINIDGRRYKIHMLVAEAFLGVKPVGLHTCHEDDNKFNNVLTNLRYDTALSNAADAVRNGRLNPATGERHGMARLTAEQVRLILADARSQRAIAADFGVSQVHVGRIKRGANWACLPAPLTTPAPEPATT